MPGKMTLSDAIDAHLLHRRSKRLAASTIRNNTYVLRRFLHTTGNLYVHNIRESHIDAHFLEAAKTRGDETLGVDHSTLNAFFLWAVRNGVMLRSRNPMEGREPPAYTPRPWRGLHISKFPALLEAASYPRDRALIALGLFGLGRASELTAIRIRDVHLESRRISVVRSKVHDVDRIPVGIELDEELRLWLKLYAEEAGPLQNDWFVIPAKTNPKLVTLPGGVGSVDLSSVQLVPTRKIYAPHKVVNRTLEAVGYPTRTPEGKPLNEGMHTLRRSGARALYDEYVAAGYPDALRRVQVILGHRSIRVTERYIGIQPDRVLRDQTIEGSLMFPSLRGVTNLRGIRGGEDLARQSL